MNECTECRAVGGTHKKWCTTREAALIQTALDLFEKRVDDGTATPAELTYFLQLGAASSGISDSLQKEDDDFEELRRKANEVEKILQNMVMDACPGPHKVSQHRDAKPPWCETCGRTVCGERIRPPK